MERVRSYVLIGVNHKDVYGPWRPTRAQAENDLARVRAQNGNVDVVLCLFVFDECHNASMS